MDLPDDNGRTLYGGYRIELAQEARELALKHRERDDAVRKQPYQRQWESVFGKYSTVTSFCHPKSFIGLFRKQGKSTFFLILLGTSASILDYSIDLAIGSLQLLRDQFSMLSSDPIAQSVLYVVFGCMFVSFSFWWVRNIDPIAVGSGIPEMKAIMSGDLHREPEKYLLGKTLLSKSVGLVCAIGGGGLSIGREGPFVHTSSIICYQLMKHIRWFDSMYRSKVMHRHFFSAACAVGVASTFAAPIGGVLFSIEVTNTFFLVSNYWKGFVAAVSGAIVKLFMDRIRDGTFQSVQPLFPTDFEPNSYSSWEFLTFLALGILMGLLGPIYIRLADSVRRYTYHATHSKYTIIYVAFVSSLISLALYLPGQYTRQSLAAAVQSLCTRQELSEIWTQNYHWTLSLSLAAGIRILVTVLSISLPVPAGDFLPTFVAGAVCGRLYGEGIAWLFSTSTIVPGGYALVGGAALVGSVTHTVSVAVIVMEFTGQFYYMIPMFIAVMIACGISRGLTCSIYEAMLRQKNVPYLPLLRCDEIKEMNAEDLMNKDLKVLTLSSSVPEIQQLLEEERFTHLPVVDTLEAMHFQGCIAREELTEMLQTTKTGPVDLTQIGTDRSILCLDHHAPAEQVHLMFELLKCPAVFIHRHGKLEGVISRRSLYCCMKYLVKESLNITV